MISDYGHGLLEVSKEAMAKLLFKEIHVLVIDEIGKNIMARARSQCHRPLCAGLHGENGSRAEDP